MIISRGTAVLGFLLLLASGSGAAVAADIWQFVDESTIPGVTTPRPFSPSRYRTVRLSEPALRNALAHAPMEFTQGHSGGVEFALPMPDGRMARFRVEESPILEPGLAAKYPDVRTYRGQGIDEPAATTRFGWTRAGFHAIVLSPGGTVYIDPYRRGDTEHVISYFSRDNSRAGRPPFECHLLRHDGTEIRSVVPPTDDAHVQELLDHRAGTLRAYRLALAADFEYVEFHSDPLPSLPSKQLAMTRGVIPTLNRVNGIYERDLSIHMNLVANNEDIVFDTPADPYVNEDGTSMLVSNQATCDAIIGPENYDIGHVFSTGGGGVAFLGVVCDNLLGGVSQKAGGVTGLPTPIGDNFDVDYVAHEMGHEFGANHTFNSNTGSCNGNENPSTAYEVGSGSTVMAYAGICAAQDLQPHSDDNFHGISLQEIINFTDGGNPNTCAVKTTVSNQAPVVDAGPIYTIPARTPFTLTAVGSDPDGDAITYNWEEFDLGPQGGSFTDNGSSPIFRPFPSTTGPSRTFPKWSTILDTPPPYGEILPTTNRTMTFRCTVRDNFAGAGAVHWDQTQVVVRNAAGPFLVLAPNGGESWDVGTSQNVTWAVAGTADPPVSAATVDVVLSTDGGASFDVVLASGAPNDGSETIVVPAVQTSEARVMVRAVDNIFFDVSNQDFTIAGRPVALDDDASTSVDTPLAIDVLANDNDPNLDPLSIATVASPTVQGGTAVSQDNGTPGDPSDDTVLYTPPSGFVGQDSFGYTISDGTYTAAALVTVDLTQSTAVGPAPFQGLALRISPNPMVEAVRIDFHLSRPTHVEMEVFSVQGRRVATLESRVLAEGARSVQWNGRAQDGTRLAAGVYLLRTAVDGDVVTRRMIVMQ